MEYKILYEGGEGEIVEKKSRFIATVRPVKTEEEALAFIESMKKKYWNATHNCSAYVIGEQAQITRCNDDKEPAGTAGRPMLEVLLGEGVRDVAVVVTRYFGGTLLGTGGLIRAYGSAVKEGLAQSHVIVKKKGTFVKISADYTLLGKVQYILGQRKIPIADTVYTDEVLISCYLQDEEHENIRTELMEGTNGRVMPTEERECWFADIGGQIVEL